MTILDQIAARRRTEIETLKSSEPLQGFLDDLDKRPPPRFKAAVSRPGQVNIIAELKKASPSKGLLKPDFNPIELARAYTAGGAAALSVLTEESHFQGRFEYLELAGRESGLPLLCKDFVVDRYQVFYAKHRGADAVLLIVALQSGKALARYLRLAGQIGIDCLVEVHDEQELNMALEAGAEIIGVNNRNLKDFSVTLETSEKLAELIPPGVVRVTESGICDNDDITRLGRSGFQAFLIGEALVTSPDPAAHLKSLRGQ